MKKVNRKIISIFLLLIIIALQIGPAVIATENMATETQTLEQYLIENGVDTDEDKKISDAEWAKVKNLDLYGWSKKISDFTGLEKAVNLQYLELEDHDFSNVNFTNFSKLKELRMYNCNANIDCSKLTNLETLILKNVTSEINNIEKLTNLEYLQIDSTICSQIDFTKLTQLKQLNIQGSEKERSVIKLPAMPKLEELACYSIYDLDISELSNLGDIFIKDCTNVKLSKFNNLKDITISGGNYINGIIDLQNCEDVSGTLDSKIDKEKIKLNKNTMLSKNLNGNFCFKKLDDEINIEINKAYKIGSGKETYKFVKNENDDVATFNSYEELVFNIVSINAEIKAKNIGTTNMTVKDILGREKTIKVNVYEPKTNNVDTKLENTGITAKFVDDLGTVLKSNGELWKVTSSTTAEKVDENVRDYQANDILNLETYEDEVYPWGDVFEKGRDGEYIPINHYEFILKNDDSLNINIKLHEVYHTYHTIKTITNVKAIGHDSYLTSDGKFYKINFNYITEELKTKLIKENVKKLLGECIVLNDGTTWFTSRKYECKKLADFEIEGMGYYPKKNYGLYDFIVTVVDKENNLWCCKDEDWGEFNDSGLKILKENSKWHKRLKHKENSHMKISENGDAVLKENNKKIMDNVSETLGSYWAEYVTLIRTDGTIWTYNIEDGLLTKITESASGDDKEEDKDFLNPTAKIHEKESGNTSILYGISDSTKIEDFKKQNNFNSTYEVKIYDKNDKELQDNNIIGTGSKVKLYKQGKIVKEYTVILYGDTTGDGKITSVDALAIIKHINNKIPFKKEEYIEAGKVRKESGKNLTSVDALATVKSVNGKYEITKNR